MTFTNQNENTIPDFNNSRNKQQFDTMVIRPSDSK